MADTAPYLDDTLYAELLLQLRADRIRKREFISSITEGVVLAVEQVQDVRLAALEQGPESSSAQLIADAFWGFLFDSGINILWSRVVVKTFLTSIEKIPFGLAEYERHLWKSGNKKVKDLAQLHQTVYGLYEPEKPTPKTDVAKLTAFLHKLDSSQFKDAKAVRDGTIDIRKLIDDAIEKEKKLTANKVGMWNPTLWARDRRVRYDSEPSSPEAAVAVEQLLNNTRAYLNQSPSEEVGTGSANLLAATYDWGSRQREQLELMSDQLEITLMQSKDLKSPAGVCLVLALTSDAVLMDLGKVRSRAWLISEAVVWAELYVANLCGEVQVLMEWEALADIAIPSRIATYLRKRFARDARIWIHSRGASDTLVPPNYTANSKVRQWASRRLLTARELAKHEATMDVFTLSKETRAKDAKARVDSAAVAAFLLAMLNCYRDNAALLATHLAALKEELK